MEESVVKFRVADKDYGAPVELVRGVEQNVRVTDVPRAASFIRGVFELRGEVLPLIDLRERLGHGRSVSANGYVLLVSIDSVSTGFLVDEVSDVLSIPDTEIEPAPAMIGGLEAKFIRGLVKSAAAVLILLDLPNLLSDLEIRQLKQLREEG